MKLFIDSADYKKIAEYAHLGLVDGVTINPTLLKAENEPPLKIVREILKVLPDAIVHLQVTEQEPRKVYEQAEQIARLAENMVVKIPCHAPYLPVIAQLIAQGIPVNATLVFNITQAYQMAKMGVHYISVFVGRLYDEKEDGIAIAQSVQDFLDSYGYDAELLIASVRSTQHVAEALKIGADSITIPPVIFDELIKSPYTQAGLEKFKDDWQNGPHNQLLE